MKIFLGIATAACILLAGCATDIYVAPDATLKKGGTIQMVRMSQDPLGGVTKLTSALLRRGFTVLEGEVGRTVTNNTSTGTETYSPTRATHYLTFTYSIGREEHASCRLVNLSTRKAEVTVDITPVTPSAADTCADAILQAAK